MSAKELGTEFAREQGACRIAPASTILGACVLALACTGARESLHPQTRSATVEHDVQLALEQQGLKILMVSWVTTPSRQLGIEYVTAQGFSDQAAVERDVWSAWRLVQPHADKLQASKVYIIVTTPDRTDSIGYSLTRTADATWRREAGFLDKD